VQGSGELRTLVEGFNRMSHDLRSATDRLVASERLAAWQEVAKRLAHELKNPLTPIQMSLETLLAASAKNDPRFQAVFKDSAAAILEEVQRLKRTIDAFSQFARLPRPELRALNLGELAAQVLALYTPHQSEGAPAAPLRFAGEFEPGLWVQADRDQLTQVLVNLLKNAQEAMEGRAGTITARTRADGAGAILEVEDEGPGVPQSQRARILEPYVSTKPNGTGLGLAITLRILEEHGGRLEVGEGGGGAVFRITLPRLSEPPAR
jgi:nitrogen fixation/metabolism regulation signal transduction histidine kinase